MNLVTKAKISGCDDKGSEEGESFYVQFNPNEISISEYTGRFAKKNVKKPGKKNVAASQKTPSEIQAAPHDESKNITFSTKLFFNTYNSASDYSDVRSLISKFDVFLNKDTKKEEDLKRIRFSWGSIQIFGMLTSMSVSYTMFSRDGNPVRAEAAISITGDYVKVALSPPPKDKETFTFADESVGFADALVAYGCMSELKKAAHASGVINLRTLT
jgi:hypothetical protein